jgi:hypothetical protein
VLKSKLIHEAESLLRQIQSFQKGLTDLMAAMQMTAMNSFELLFPSSSTAKTSIANSSDRDSIFNFDHLQEIMYLYSLFDQEYHRKKALVTSLLADDDLSRGICFY